jgi:hypothetical protein
MDSMMDSDSIWTWIALVGGVAVLLAPLWIGLLVMGRQRSVSLFHAKSGLQKNGYYGYSWTYLFFGFLVPIFRGEIGIGLLHLVFSVLTGGLFQIIMSYLYNKQFTQRQILAGWEIRDPASLGVQARRRLAIA